MSKLSELAIGKSAVVQEITNFDEIGIRLMEMGITPGVSLTILGTAPFGDPIEIEVRGYRLSLRKSEAARVEVEIS